jgi:integrase
MPLSDVVIKSAKPGPKAQRLFDGGGLYLEVAPSGGKWWRLKYRHEGKEKRLSLGTYPATSLKDARDRRDQARRDLAAGIDPGAKRKAEKETRTELAANTFEVVAREWHKAVHTAKVSEGHAARNLLRLEQDAFPWFGALPIADITAPKLLEALRKVEARGAIETAHRVRQVCGQVFRYGIATGRCERDPAADLRDTLQPVIVTHHAAILDPKQVGALLRAFDDYQGLPTTRAALKLAPLVFLRPGELRQAEWAEFDLDAAMWTIPAGATRPMSENGVLSALRRMGYGKDEMSGHGFRAMARTLMAERLNIPEAVIEAQLAHAVKDSLGRAYNRTEFVEQRRQMMQRWADYLDSLKQGAQVLPFKTA